MTVITIHMRKNDGLEKKIFFFFFVFSHPGGSFSLLGVRESGCISVRLPDDPGGFTCMLLRFYNCSVENFKASEAQVWVGVRIPRPRYLHPHPLFLTDSVVCK